ncbi:MAG: type 1 periplasmic binding fold superfamily protein [Bacteroidota bacterium]
MQTLFKLNRFFLPALGVVLMMTACVKEPDNVEEEIDTVVLTFNNGGPTVTWKDGTTTTPDFTLDANTTYTVSAEFKNEENGEDVTTEIKAEDADHFICFELSGGANLTIAATDSDGTYPIGLASSWEAGDASTGTLLMKLRHQPGVKDGTCAPGESDVEVDFNITIE